MFNICRARPPYAHVGCLKNAMKIQQAVVQIRKANTNSVFLYLFFPRSHCVCDCGREAILLSLQSQRETAIWPIPNVTFGFVELILSTDFVYVTYVWMVQLVKLYLK
jgi:hypothetical protein